MHKVSILSEPSVSFSLVGEYHSTLNISTFQQNSFLLTFLVSFFHHLFSLGNIVSQVSFYILVFESLFCPNYCACHYQPNKSGFINTILIKCVLGMHADAYGRQRQLFPQELELGATTQCGAGN